MTRASLALAILGTGCGEPISNQVLYEDEVFLAAIPSIERMAPPSEVRLARVGTSALLEAAVGEAAALDGLADVIGATGEILRNAPPDERSDTTRSWEPIQTSIRIDGVSRTFWVRGQISRPIGSSSLDWIIEGSESGEAPWMELGSGAHGEEGEGLFTWQLQDHADLLRFDGELPLTLDISYLPEGGESVRELEIEDPDAAFGNTWHVAGDNAIIWFGSFALVDQEEPQAGAAQVLHAEGIGGRGTGVRFTQQGEEPFDVCWDANGNDVWLQTAALPTVGSEGACALDF